MRLLAPFIVVALVAVWAGNAVLDSRLLQVDRIVVRGTTRLPVADVETLVDDLRGRSILRVDLDEYRTRVLASPWVADVTLFRVLPSTVELHVLERLPLAVARLDGRLYLIDAAGVIIDTFGPQYREFDLPIVDGLVSSPGTEAPVVSLERVRLTARFLAALEAAPDLRDRVSQVDVSNPRDVTVLLAGDSAWLHIGDEAFAERLETYLVWAPALRERFPALDYVDLRFGERLFVRANGQDIEVPRE